MKRVIVIGGGAAGMMAAVRSAQRGHRTSLLERNEKLGKKVYITGKGRCNFTNACEMEELFAHVMRNPKFLYSAFYAFSNFQAIDFFEGSGMATKTERGNRVFPASDKASDVTAALQRNLRRYGAEVSLNARVQEILVEGGHAAGVRLAGGKAMEGDAVVIATGGCSYPSTGSAGDGYLFAQKLGHTVTKRYPSLTPFETAEEWAIRLQGLSLRNMSVTIGRDGKKLYEGFGEMLFTHFGVSGPLILSASSVLNDEAERMPLSMAIDLKPALSREQLERRLLRELEGAPNKEMKNVARSLYPAKLAPVMLGLCGIPGEKKANAVTRQERQHLVELTKDLPVTLTRLRGFTEAIITRGGVSVKEVNPSTMESRIVPGVYFAGEVLDLDALTGGFNLQIAWSTGYLAGDSV